MELKKLCVQQIKPYENNPRKNDQAVDAGFSVSFLRLN